MPAKDLGTKHVCFKCGARFYDLKKPEPLCPKCGTDQRQNPALKAPAEKRRPAPRPAPAPVAAEEEVDAPDLDADEDEDADADDEKADADDE
jgi:hypothetical protein